VPNLRIRIVCTQFDILMHALQCWLLSVVHGPSAILISEKVYLMFNIVCMQTTCLTCPLGSVTTETNSTSCAPCSAGFYSIDPTQPCVPCPAGTFQASIGQVHSRLRMVMCYMKQSGYFFSPRQSSCIPCAVNYYALSTGSTTCDACPSVYVDCSIPSQVRSL
jgi:hypothetical protein